MTRNEASEFINRHLANPAMLKSLLGQKLDDTRSYHYLLRNPLRKVVVDAEDGVIERVRIYGGVLWEGRFWQRQYPITDTKRAA